jgi:5-methyltetrahydrofolate--homocysteine methyltransferase
MDGDKHKMSEDLDITQLETPEILELIQDDLYEGLADEVVASVNELLAREMTPYDLLNQGLVAGMDIVGADFRDGILFVPEVLMAAKAMKAGMAILRPLLIETGAPQLGTLVIGTVKGDIHDIGKNLVSMMMEGAGFNVVNLGINTNVESFLEAIHEHKPDILGMSAMLTTTMPYMAVVIEALEQEGLREQLLVLVGGAPLNDAFAEEIRADAYCRDAAVGVETAKKMLAVKRGQLN